MGGAALVVLIGAAFAWHAFGQRIPGASSGAWKTDFTKRTVPLEEIISGGPPRDGIPPIDRPRFMSHAKADQWLKPVEPVIVFGAGGETRAYPLQILTWHEIVNDVVGGIPVAVTFCPLCNSAIVFDRRVGGRVLDFGTTGLLRKSDLVMWDRQTESWWQQMTGVGLVGHYAGTRLTMLPASIVSYADFAATHPAGQVLSRDTGHARPYGRNPYAGYDRADLPPFLLAETPDPRLPPKERVVAVTLDGVDKAYPYSALASKRVVHDRVGSTEIVLFHVPGTASALDASEIVAARDVGAAGVFLPAAGGTRLTFAWRAGRIVDTASGSTWNVLGHAIDGPHKGQTLPPVLHGDHFAFAWLAFKPQTIIWKP